MNTDLKQKLADLKGLYEDNLIDEAEYRKEKDALLSAARTGSGGPSSSSGNTGSGDTGPGVRRKPDTNLTIDDEVSPFFPGAMLGQKDRPYKLGQRLGAGGMGQVWQALDIKDSETVGREVWKAVKILPVTAESDPGQYKALKQEAMLAEQLRHPHIVSVFGWREDQITGIPFIVMEWLQGKDLGTVLAEEGDPGLPFERVVSLLDPVIEALDYAWKQHQIVHRDIKPANVFLTEAGEIKLLDFGIAARIGKTGSSFGLKGREQAGTPGYRPPEAKAKRKPAPSWDVYGLGALTYELLTGNPPFDEDRAPYTPAPDAPENLNDAQWQVLQKAFAFDERNRIPSVKEFWQAIQGAKGSTPEEIEWHRQEDATTSPEAEARRKLEETTRLKAEAEAEAKQRAAVKRRAEEQARQEAEERARKEAQEKAEAKRCEDARKTEEALAVEEAKQQHAASESVLPVQPAPIPVKKFPAGLVAGIVAVMGVLAVVSMSAKKEPQSVAMADPLKSQAIGIERQYVIRGFRSDFDGDVERLCGFEPGKQYRFVTHGTLSVRHDDLGSKNMPLQGVQSDANGQSTPGPENRMWALMIGSTLPDTGSFKADERGCEPKVVINIDPVRRSHWHLSGTQEMLVTFYPKEPPTTAVAPVPAVVPAPTPRKEYVRHVNLVVRDFNDQTICGIRPGNTTLKLQETLIPWDNMVHEVTSALVINGARSKPASDSGYVVSFEVPETGCITVSFLYPPDYKTRSKPDHVFVLPLTID